MELLIFAGFAFICGAVAISAAAQRATPPAPVIYVQAEPLERREGEGGGALLLFVLVVIIALMIL